MIFRAQPTTTCRSQKNRQSVIALALSLAFASTGAFGLNYGIYDARALALGGTAVALGSAQNAQFYNPALLATYEGREDFTKNGRFYFPSIVAQGSDNISETQDILDRDADTRMTDAVTAFNANPSATNAGQVLDAATYLQQAITDLGNRDLNVDAFFGLSVSEPSDHAGGAFYAGTRIVGVGNSNIDPADVALLNDYIEAMQFVSSGGTSGTAHPELLDANGALINPNGTIQSSAAVSSLAISEWGLSMAKEFWFGPVPISFGVTPKLMRVDVYSKDISYGDTSIDYQDEKRSYTTANVDVGMLIPIGEHFRVGVAAKDLIPTTFQTANGSDVKFKSRSRFGAAYTSHFVDIGVDVDMQKNDSVTGGTPLQEASIGMELRPFRWIDFRLGYRQDMEGLRGGVSSGGLKLKFGPFITELAYAVGDNVQGGGLQFGWAF